MGVNVVLCEKSEIASAYNELKAKGLPVPDYPPGGRVRFRAHGTDRFYV